MKKSCCKEYLPVVLSVWVAFVFLQSLFFKFADSPETQHIFGTIADWMQGNFLSPLANVFGQYGGYAIGTAELIVSIILLVSLGKYTYGKIKKKNPSKCIVTGQRLGGIGALAIMSGAIFFHLATPLGVNVQGDGGLLFGMAISVWISGFILAFLPRK